VIPRTEMESFQRLNILQLVVNYHQALDVPHIDISQQWRDDKIWIKNPIYSRLDLGGIDIIEAILVRRLLKLELL
jgi:hypothetical protein